MQKAKDELYKIINEINHKDFDINSVNAHDLIEKIKGNNKNK